MACLRNLNDVQTCPGALDCTEAGCADRLAETLRDSIFAQLSSKYPGRVIKTKLKKKNSF